jgi:mannose-6-phosphate isomerase
MKELYPLKFKPIIHDKIWGGAKLRGILNKPIKSDKAGESWEISTFPENISVVQNGFLKGNNLVELIEIYMGELVGDRIYKKFGLMFPLLIKFIDANDNLSIQVHPNDMMAKKRHDCFGKTEMWYVMQAEKDARLILGFNHKSNKDEYLYHLGHNTLLDLLHNEVVKEGDVFFLPAGRVHAIGAGILLTEIQQTSDMTYRIYDFDRKDAHGKPRELHTELALDSINFEDHKDFKTNYSHESNLPVELITCPYFTTKHLHLTQKLERDWFDLDCFVIYICLDGSCEINYKLKEKINLTKGETILIPAMFSEYSIVPDSSVRMLEVYIGKEAFHKDDQ